MSGIYPSPEHIEHIQFDGRDCVVLSPEDYEEMHFDITHLRARVADLEASERDGLVIHTPLPVFGDGPWIFTETGQKFTGDELNIEAFCRYRNALLAAPVPYGFGHLPQVATEDMQDNMRTALIDQGWTSDSAGEVDFQDIWDAAVVQFVESSEDAYAAILSAKEKGQ